MTQPRSARTAQFLADVLNVHVRRIGKTIDDIQHREASDPIPVPDGGVTADEVTPRYRQTRTMYMCHTAFAEDCLCDEVALYSSVEALKKNRRCWVECGILEVTLREERTVVVGREYP